MSYSVQTWYLSVVVCLVIAGCSNHGTLGPKTSDVSLISIMQSDIPYSKQIKMKAGDAWRFRLPNSMEVAVWCIQFPGIAEQRTASGLKTCWGEKPLKHLEIEWETQSDGTEVAGEWKSYIRQGPVITSGLRETSESVLYVGKWKFSIIEDLSAKDNLPVTISLAMATEEERVLARHKWAYFLENLKSPNAAKRLVAVQELADMIYLGNMYAGSRSQLLEKLRPLAEDPDPRVAEQAKRHMERLSQVK